MKLSEFDYNLPEALIAQEPKKKRDHSRLLLLDKKRGQITHHTFSDLPDFLHSGDLIIMNNSMVIPARLIGMKEITHGKVEILLHRQLTNNVWEALGRSLKIDGRIIFDGSNLEAVPLEKKEDLYKIRFNLTGKDLTDEIEKIGITPIPPYIRHGKSDKSDVINYQTVYAKVKGSVAAPTAGLHFTKDLLEKIKQKNIDIDFVTLHVGLGTFTPVKVDDVRKHHMHKEYFEIGYDLIKKIGETRKRGGKIIAVGTTTARVLESVYNSSKDYKRDDTGSIAGYTDIFIYPGYKFKCVDSLITNFHFPKSTLLLLVSALAGKENIKKAYEEAISQSYRFYSYGDAMFIQ